MKPFISICIPAYKRVTFLKRLLDSIVIQNYKDFEVVVTDDSDDQSVEKLVELYKSNFQLNYKKNVQQLGTPANWNVAIALAKGEWIKLIHDDDWFASSRSLEQFAEHTKLGKKFIFSAYTNYFENNDEKTEHVYILSSWKNKILKEPNVLLAKNIVGPPSVTMLHRSVGLTYDERLKWRVDQEFYIRVLQQDRSYCYISQLLINVGISESQVTQYCFNQPEVELPEGYILLEKQGTKKLKNIWVYDTWWRLLRNLNIRSVKTLQRYVPKSWPDVIQKIVKDLATVPSVFLKNGISSKIFMGLSYLKNYSSIK